MNGLKLKSIEVLEKRDSKVELRIKNFPVGEFNLLISDNAQGKSRLFRMLDYLSSLSKSNARVIGTEFSAKLKFEIFVNKKVQEIVYKINIAPKNEKNDFNELVARDKKTVFSSKDNILFNETKKSKSRKLFYSTKPTRPSCYRGARFCYH